MFRNVACPVIAISRQIFLLMICCTHIIQSVLSVLWTACKVCDHCHRQADEFGSILISRRAHSSANKPVKETKLGLLEA